MQKDAKRNFALDVLRVLACYMVIQVHTGEFYYIGPVGDVIKGENAFWVDLYNSVCRSAVPLFVMLTGYFLLPVKDEPAQFFRRRFTRVVIPFIFWCIAYSFYQFFRGQVDFATACVNILKIPVNFGTQVGHLWYVYMLMGLYLFAPIISPWLKTASRKSIELYLGIWAFSLCVPYIHLVFPEVLGECFWNGTPMLYYFSGLLGYMILLITYGYTLPNGKAGTCRSASLCWQWVISLPGTVSTNGYRQPNMSRSWKSPGDTRLLMSQWWQRGFSC